MTSVFFKLLKNFNLTFEKITSKHNFCFFFFELAWEEKRQKKKEEFLKTQIILEFFLF